MDPVSFASEKVAAVITCFKRWTVNAQKIRTPYQVFEAEYQTVRDLFDRELRLITGTEEATDNVPYERRADRLAMYGGRLKEVQQQYETTVKDKEKVYQQKHEDLIKILFFELSDSVGHSLADALIKNRLPDVDERLVQDHEMTQHDGMARDDEQIAEDGEQMIQDDHHTVEDNEQAVEDDEQVVEDDEQAIEVDEPTAEEPNVDEPESAPNPAPHQDTDQAINLRPSTRRGTVTCSSNDHTTENDATMLGENSNDEKPHQDPSTTRPTTRLSSKQPDLDAEAAEQDHRRKRQASRSPDAEAQPTKRPRRETVTEPSADNGSIEFDEVFQNGNASTKYIVSRYPPRDGKWYIFECKEHHKHFVKNPIFGAAKHLASTEHGGLAKWHHLAVKMLGIHVLNCTSQLAEKNNIVARKAFDQGLGIPPGSNPKNRRSRAAPSEPKPAQAKNSRAQMPDGPSTKGNQALVDARDPKPGEIYAAFWSDSRDYYPILILPWGGFRAFKWENSLRETGLLDSIPSCYLYDKGKDDRPRGWAPGYEDGGPRFSRRKYPVIFFEGLNFPDGCAVGWVYLKSIKIYNPQHAEILHRDTVQEFLDKYGAYEDRGGKARSEEAESNEVSTNEFNRKEASTNEVSNDEVGNNEERCEEARSNEANITAVKTDEPSELGSIICMVGARSSPKQPEIPQQPHSSPDVKQPSVSQDSPGNDESAEDMIICISDSEDSDDLMFGMEETFADYLRRSPIVPDKQVDEPAAGQQSSTTDERIDGGEEQEPDGHFDDLVNDLQEEGLITNLNVEPESNLVDGEEAGKKGPSQLTSPLNDLEQGGRQRASSHVPQPDIQCSTAEETTPESPSNMNGESTVERRGVTFDVITDRESPELQNTTTGPQDDPNAREGGESTPSDHDRGLSTRNEKPVTQDRQLSPQYQEPSTQNLQPSTQRQSKEPSSTKQPIQATPKPVHPEAQDSPISPTPVFQNNNLAEIAAQAIMSASPRLTQNELPRYQAPKPAGRVIENTNYAAQSPPVGSPWRHNGSYSLDSISQPKDFHMVRKGSEYFDAILRPQSEAAPACVNTPKQPLTSQFAPPPRTQVPRLLPSNSPRLGTGYESPHKTSRPQPTEGVARRVTTAPERQRALLLSDMQARFPPGSPALPSAPSPVPSNAPSPYLPSAPSPLGSNYHISQTMLICHLCGRGFKNMGAKHNHFMVQHGGRGPGKSYIH
ncbi:hypothetical protein FZEAL_3748 [Fusarium zealandicum]|uniref:C2H2-type domain-containing protein n=1 Tax=Fusarium zealandicum TaxID=1053134 RepID=A0A8H4XLG5_9HYPO|nr:hypothetical protein FZEAL_3748 [Fusarium zealandicum]